MNKIKIFIILFAVFTLLAGGCADKKPENDNYAIINSDIGFDGKIEALKKEILDISNKKNIKYNAKNSGYAVFLSISDMYKKAVVFNAAGVTPQEAFNNAVKITEKYIKENNYNACWIKADIVNTVKKTSPGLLKLDMAFYRKNSYRKGIAFDRDFNIALLEQEVNSNNIIDYKKKAIELENVNTYLKARGATDTFDKIPSKIYMFTTIGFFSDENNTVYPLYNNEPFAKNKYQINYARRKIKTADDKVIAECVDTTIEFLKKNVLNDGSFIYGYYPIANRRIGSYNILRHAGACWSLIEQYSRTKDASLIPYIERTLGYLESSIEFLNDDTAYVIERKADEVKLGGNAIAVLAFASYTEYFNNDRYRNLVIQLTNGILSFWDEDGLFNHVLNYPSYSLKDKYRTVYYDGEAAYALARAYTLTEQEKFLDAARKAVEYFIKNNYQKHRSNWVAHAVNEVTKHYPDRKFLEFGLNNARTSLTAIFSQDTLYHTYFELLMATFELYDRIIDTQPDFFYLKLFNEKTFINTIFTRAEYMLNYYIYPETAMYFPTPQVILGAFFVRHDDYRMRIDDQQHVAGGYISFLKNYEKLSEYKNKSGRR
jgi:hypothetical protein